MTFKDETSKNIVSALKLIPMGILIGILGGLLGTVFHTSLDYVTELRVHFPYLLYFLPLGGIVIAFLYKYFSSFGNIDIKRVFQSVREKKDIPFVMIPLIFSGTLITHMFGGSAGREGAALQLGGSMGYNLARKLKKDDDSTKMFVTAGMSSVFSALFGVPFAATIFSFEVTRKDLLNFNAVLLAFISSLVSFIVSQTLNVAPVRFDLPEIPQYHVSMILKACLLAFLCAIVCIIFATSIHKSEFFMKKYIQNCYLRAVIGGLFVVLLTLILKTTDYNGAGMNVIEKAVLGESKNYAFILKIIFTAITISAGFKGGEIVPTFFIGATFGCFIGGLIGFDGGVGACLGLVAMFAGMTKCPIASLLLAVEVFGGKGIPLFAVVIIVAFIFSGHFGLYDNVSYLKCFKDEIC